MPLADARRLTEKTAYFPGITNTGWHEEVLVDPGIDEAAYVATGATTVVVTHGHADHFSTAAAIRRAGARVVAPREEATLIENPEVNIRGMFSWAKPSDEMVTKLFRGEGCPVDGYLDEWRRPGLQAVPLAGHTLGHTGVMTDDGVFFTGDALYVTALWERHPLPYCIDPTLVRVSLDLIGRLGPDWIVPGHGDPVEGAAVATQIAHHRDRIDAISAALLDILRVPHTTEEAIAALCEHLQIAQNPAQYWLAVTTVKGFLSELLQQGFAEFFIDAHRGCWQAL
ncbi:MAG: MBL fold metallo-hydrolase [Anaerosomatales bacterium]|nr:MBL fold metallo-hydrolase [Anaerosomatales bacterium]